jgi:hypothetical protein
MEQYDYKRVTFTGSRAIQYISMLMEWLTVVFETGFSPNSM